jgi:hypothetical protein
MKKIFFLVLLIKSTLGYTQDRNAEFSKNLVHFDFASAIITGMYSVNYERIILVKEDGIINLNFGFGRWYLLTSEHTESAYSLPIYTNLLVGKNHHFELDLGVRVVFVDKPVELKKIDYFPIINIGYRFQKHVNGIVFRSLVGLSGIGFGLGYEFK